MRSSGSHINGCELLLLDEESMVAAALLHSCPRFRLFGEKEAMQTRPARGRRRKTPVCVRGRIKGRGRKGKRTGRRGSLASKRNQQHNNCSHPKPMTCGLGKPGPTSDREDAYKLLQTYFRFQFFYINIRNQTRVPMVLFTRGAVITFYRGTYVIYSYHFGCVQIPNFYTQKHYIEYFWVRTYQDLMERSSTKQCPPLHRCKGQYIASAIGQKGAAQRSALIRQGAETVPSQDAA